MPRYRAQTPVTLGQTYPGHYPATPVFQGGLLPRDFVDDAGNAASIETLLANGAIAVADGEDDRYTQADRPAAA
jgi:hypothetical protein